MLMSPAFKNVQAIDGAYVFNRSNSIVGQVVLPEELQNRLTYDINIEEETGSVVFSAGDRVHIITDEFGVVGGKDSEVGINLFFIDGGVAIELDFGRIAIKGDNGEVVYIDENGDIEYPGANDRINWYTEASLKEKVSRVTHYKFGTSDDSTSLYVSNLYFAMTLGYPNTQSGPMEITKVDDYFDALTLGKLAFVNYNVNEFLDEEDDDHVDLADLVDVDEDEEEEYDMNTDDEDEEEVEDLQKAF
jgi:hypothetical protein